MVVNAIPVPATGNLNVPSTGGSVSSSPSPIPVSLSTRDLYLDIGLEARGGGSNERSTVVAPAPTKYGTIIHYASQTDDTDLMERFERELKIIMDKSDAERAALHKQLVDINRVASLTLALFPGMNETRRARALAAMQQAWQKCHTLKQIKGRLDPEIDRDLDNLMGTVSRIPGFDANAQGGSTSSQLAQYEINNRIWGCVAGQSPRFQPTHTKKRLVKEGQRGGKLERSVDALEMQQFVDEAE
ncbi:hypothetical protein H0H93_003430 [Arthromyces matolae]|nr:hypothetical protein H0H93_003430 [Arthromyces matolae]